MNKRTGIAVILAAFTVAVLMAATPLYAEDEELDSTVYMVFDPESGELIMVEEPSGKKKPHTPSTAQSQDGQDATDGSTASMPVTYLLGGFVVLGLVGGAIAWIRNGRKLA